ncbi:MAG: short-chain dehydrogenase [Rhodospirillaceae bacterium TMED8]|nr:short-chain dehydrogenase [Magnetovibrio sp.]OUT47941.1 MAG: short-chain dehydrogenase [Rhodospirillaceae bacterium TMED8]|tara:strand:+ start:4618 stop:5382 length:765 start_codon:yes stop_codon:yes gene_type:complete
MQKTVIITGGTKGIGAGIAEEFIAAGWSTVLGARHDNGLANDLGKGCCFHAMDVSKASHHIAAIEFAMNWTGRFDVYVNCAGLSAWRDIGNIDPEFWNTMVATNLTGTLWGCQAATAAFIRSKTSGSIVNVSSLAGKRGSARNSAYCATKFGVNGITQSLAKELGSAGIRVNAVCPVYVATPGVLEALAEEASPAKTAGEGIQRYLEEFAQSNAALQRLPRAHEVGELCVYLASKGAGAITGQCINVDCGVLPQ